MENRFSENLPILRRRAGYTQETLAEALGVSRQAVGKWESGLTMPEAGTLLTLAQLLDCSLDALMRDELPGEAQAEAAQAETQALPQEEPLTGSIPDGEELWEEESDPWYFYAQHKDRFSLMIALGVSLILTGVSLMLALNGLFGYGENGLTVIPLLLCIALAVFLFVNAGLAEDEVEKLFPVCPPCPDWEEYETFRQRFRLLIPAAVAGILLGVAVMVGGGLLFQGNEAMTFFVTALFLGILAVCVGILVYMGIQSEKFPEEK